MGAVPALLRLGSRRPTFAIDLGTAFVRVSTPDQPLAAERSTQLMGRRPPAMRGGVVHDIEAAADVLAGAVHDVTAHGVRRARMVVSVPATATSVERAGVRWALHAADLRGEVVLIDEPLAAAIGLGLDIADDTPHLVVDVGHGITEAAVVSNGTIVALAGARVGCAQLDDPQRSAMALERIARCVHDAMAQLPTDVAAAIDALHLVGGGSLSGAVSARLAADAGVRIVCADDPIHAVARGDVLCAVEAFGPRRRGRTSG